MLIGVTNDRGGGCLRRLNPLFVARRLLILLLAIVALISACVRLVAQSITPSPISHEANRVQLSIAMRIIAKSIVIGEPLLMGLKGTDYSRAMEDLDNILQTLVKSRDVEVLRDVGILYAYLGVRQRALECLNEFMRLGSESGRLTRDELNLWRKMLSEKTPSIGELKALERKIEALNLGWFERLAKAWLYERTFMFVQSEKMRTDARLSAARSLLPLLILLMLLIALFLIGVVLTPILLLSLSKQLRLRRKDAADANLNLYVLLEAFVVYLFMMEVVTPTITRSLLPRVRGTHSVETSLIAAMVISVAITSLSILWLVLSLRANSVKLSAVGLKGDAIVKDLWHGLLAYVSMLPWIWLASAFSMLLSKWLSGVLSEPIHPVAQALMLTSSTALMVTAFIIGTLIAPIVEELIFRGALYNALKGRIGLFWGAILSSLLFALLHPQSIVGAFPLFVIGVGLSLLYEARRSIVGCVFAHALINFVSLLALMLFTSVR
ncbi:MAG: CPBP family glutamic-type intramembrane protease [Armatimonadota bacterium]|nr:CPBP family glutamic-type intramembrane protease [Armatimonadota bacterium]MCX7777295.1 CPBP family glutamic-type intramembrane protease [Armatimonadota bacterium]MDW8024388.1 CPBP family glutamic-type intramembrane protease [Armatimonadota bacterium]